jgi:soluble lytic murein transglycosylase-like protein
MFRKVVLGLLVFLLGFMALPKVSAWESEPSANALRVREFIARARLVDLRWLVVPQEWRKGISLLEEAQKHRVSLAPVIEAKQLPIPKFAYSKLVLPLSEKHGMDWKLVAAVMAVESNYNPKAVSTKGAVGLMQLMPRTARLYSTSYQELFNPQKNIEAGVQHLKKLHDRYEGDLSLVLAAYNSGESAVNRFKGVPPYRDTKAFVKKVMARYNSHAKKERLAVAAVSDIRSNRLPVSSNSPAAYR